MDRSTPLFSLASILGHGRPVSSVPLAIDAEIKSLDTVAVGRLAYYADTSKKGRPLVLLHSINAAASSYEMRPLFEAFRHERPVYALDWPGFGRSSRDKLAYDSRTYRLALERFLIDVVEAKHGVDVIALSLASEFAAHVANLLPSQFHSLTMVSPTGVGSKSSGPPAAMRRVAGRVTGIPVVSDLLWKALSSQKSLEYYLAKSFKGQTDQGLLDYAGETVRAEGAENAPFAFLAGRPFTPDVFESVYKKLHVPTLIVHDEDPYTSFERVPDLISEGSSIRRVRISLTQGLPQFDALGRFKDALHTFWRGLPRADHADGMEAAS